MRKYVSFNEYLIRPAFPIDETGAPTAADTNEREMNYCHAGSDINRVQLYK